MTDWSPLTQELAEWREATLALPFWWRDDDAVSETPALHRLAEMTADVGMPVFVAVIPADADASLARFVERTPHVSPLVHGWAHRNHASPGEKKAEFGSGRRLEERIGEARSGRNRLQDLFGARLNPIFVPPWNRIGSDLLPHLPELGFTALSAFAPRTRAQAAHGLAQINTHIDPIDWRGTRSLVAPERLIAQTVALLRNRRIGVADNSEPLGLLTHHLVHDAAIWSFCAELAGRLMSGPAVPWHPVKRNTPDEPS